MLEHGSSSRTWKGHDREAHARMGRYDQAVVKGMAGGSGALPGVARVMISPARRVPLI